MRARKAGILVLMLMVVLGLLAGCDGKSTESEPIESRKSRSGKTAEEGSTKKKRGGDEDVAGRYDAIKVFFKETGEEFQIAYGDYLILNEDGSTQVFFSDGESEELTEMEADYKDRKFYIDGDTKVGEVNDDGTILLYVNDEMNMLFAREGQPGYDEWLDFAAWVEEQNQFGYDFTEAKKFIGDYQGLVEMTFDVNQGKVIYGGKNLGEFGRSVFARIVIDEAGEPQVYFRTEIPDWINFNNTKGTFHEDGSLEVSGEFGDAAWRTTIEAPAAHGDLLEIHGTRDDGNDGELFVMYLKPRGATWDASELPYSSEKSIHALETNISWLSGKTLDEALAMFQEQIDIKLNAQLDWQSQIHILTDDLPDSALLDLYTDGNGSGSAGTKTSSGKTAGSADVMEFDGYNVRILKFEIEESAFTDGYEYQMIIEVENTGSETVNIAISECDIVDASGNVIQTDGHGFYSTCPGDIQPGEKGYLYTDYGEELEGVTDIEGIQLVPRIECNKSYSELVDYEVSDVSIGEDGDGVVISGNVTNQTDRDASFFSVDVVLFDKNGDVICIVEDVMDSVPAGETAAFQTFGYDMPEGVTPDMIGDYSVFARDSVW